MACSSSSKNLEKYTLSGKLSNFQKEWLKRLDYNPWVICEEKVRYLMASEAFQKLSKTKDRQMEEFLLLLVSVVEGFARPPISKFVVGIAGLTSKGNIYCGVNLEFTGAAGLCGSVHGEQFMIANLLAHCEDQLVALAGAWPPCGHCRQYICELGCADTLKLIIGRRNEQMKSFSLAQLLPEAFTPNDLDISERVSFKSSSTKQSLSYSHEVSSASTTDYQSDLHLQVRSLSQAARAITVPEQLRKAALKAANLSYSPYSNSPCGIGIEMDTGDIYSGFYIENAAHNPSFPPLQSALVHIVMNFQDYSQIKHVLVVETENALVVHAPTAKTVLSGIAPNAKFSKLIAIDLAKQ